MKKSGFFAVSAAAAYATVASGYSFNPKFKIPNQEACSSSDRDDSSSGKSTSSDKFVPRYDGLRFIETLVTGHR